MPPAGSCHSRAPGGCDRLCARGLPGHGAPGELDRHGGAGTRAVRRMGANFPSRGRTAARRRETRQSGPGAHPAGAGRGRPRRLLRRAGGAGDGAPRTGERRLLRRRRPGRAKGELGRAAARQLPRPHALRDAGADPGIHGAADAQAARALRTAQDGFRGPAARPPDGAGQADRVSRPRPLDRRPRLRQRADGAAAVRRTISTSAAA